MYPLEYIQYLVHFHGDRDYFECHEILEEYWKKTDAKNKQSVWVALILLAVSCYHHRRGNFSGALKTSKNALSIIRKDKNSIVKLGINADELMLLMTKLNEDISKQLPYRNINIPIEDEGLKKSCRNECVSLGIEWKNTQVVSADILHRHILRDRSTVLKEREMAVIERQKRSNQINKK